MLRRARGFLLSSGSARAGVLVHEILIVVEIPLVYCDIAESMCDSLFGGGFEIPEEVFEGS